MTQSSVDVVAEPAERQPVAFDCGSVILRGDQWAGGGADRHVLFLHGGGQTRHSWGAAAQTLAAKGWTCTTLDLRGHGESDWSPDGQYQLDRHVDDIRQVMAQLNSHPVIVGASLGGLTALTLQGQDGDAARALVLVDIVPRPHADGVRRITDFMTRYLDGFASLEDVADAVADYNKRPRKKNLDGLHKNVRLHDDGRWYWHWDPRIVTMRPIDEPRPGVDPESIMSAASRVQIPVLVVRGAQSDVVDDDGMKEFLAAVPSAHVVDVPGAGHMVAGDDNDLFIRAVENFLEQLPTSGT